MNTQYVNTFYLYLYENMIAYAYTANRLDNTDSSMWDEN